jgi:hypothetical protein
MIQLEEDLVFAHRQACIEFVYTEKHAIATFVEDNAGKPADRERYANLDNDAETYSFAQREHMLGHQVLRIA